MMCLTFGLPMCLLLLAPVVAGQAPPPAEATSSQGALASGVPVQRDVTSGQVHSYDVTMGAGDLVLGTVGWRGVALLVEGIDSAGRVLRADRYRPSDGGALQQAAWGFVAPADGRYRVRISVFDDFELIPGRGLVPVRSTAVGGYTMRFDVQTVAARMQGPAPPVREDYTSARLRRLAGDVKAGRPEALDAFWRDLAGTGPIVEPVSGNDLDVDVTFVWRQIYDTRNVLLLWAAYRDYLSHLPGTDVWYKTLRLRRGTRVPYLFFPNHEPPAVVMRATAQLDPLNPRRFPDEPDPQGFDYSVLDLPGAPDEQWVRRTPRRRGTIEERTIASTILEDRFGNERRLWIYTPPGYSPTGGPYPLVILQSGIGYVNPQAGAAPTTLDNLIDAGRIRPPIVVFDEGSRGAGPAVRARYGDALVRELIPMLRKEFPISASPADTIVGGYSAGGSAAAEIALRYPDVFGNVLAQSGSFRGQVPWDTEPNSISRAYLAAPPRPIRFFLSVGLYDNVRAADRPLYELLLDETNLMGNRHLRDVLRGKGYDVTYREVGGGHDWLHWRATLADGLMTLLGR